MAARRESYRVGDLAVDVGLQRVAGPAGEIALPKLSFELFIALIRRAPDFVTNEDLAAAVWPGLVVSPETVTKRVNLLREALGDDPSAPRYIAGLRARGYRILVPVGADVATADASLATKAASSRRRRYAVAGLAAAVAAGIALAAWWGGRHPASGVPDAPAGPVLSPTAIAIVDFENLSPSKDDAYLAVGIPEMVFDQLAQMPQLTVVAGGPMLLTEDGAPDLRAVARKLRARYLLTGSTQRMGDQLRVSARLVDADSGRPVWSTRLDRPLAEIFAIQDEIAARVADELRSRAPLAARPAPVRRHEPPIDAQLAYLKGRSLLSRHTVRGAEEAAARFEQAVALDPQFAAAMAGHFDARMLAAERRHDDQAQALARWQPDLDRAFATDPDCGPAYVARALWVAGDAQRRDADFRRGLALEPANGRGLVAYSEFLDAQGRFEEAGRFLDRAMEVDPLSPRLHFRLVMRDFTRHGIRFREAGLKRVLELDPDYQPALQRYAKGLWMQHGDLAEATRILEHAVAVDPENPWSRHTLAALYLDLGDEPAARAVAAGTDSSRRTLELLLAQFRGDWKAAGEVAYSPAGVEYNVYETWGLPEAVRDHALMTGEHGRAITFLQKRYGLEGDEPALDISNFRPAAYVAQLLRESGDAARAERLLERLPGAIDASLPRYGTVFALRTKATVQLLGSDRAAALRTLAESFAADDVMQWWYTVNHDPLWKPLHGDPEFAALASQLRARVAKERAGIARPAP